MPATALIAVFDSMSPRVWSDFEAVVFDLSVLVLSPASRLFVWAEFFDAAADDSLIASEASDPSE
jgi:hypothetical protein